MSSSLSGPARLALATMSLIAVSTVTFAAGTATSIDKVPGKLTTPEGRAVFDREIRGTPQADGFGTQLPEGFTAAQLVRQMVPGANPAALVLAGVKPWPGQPDRYVAVVCLAETPERATNERKYWKDQCRTDSTETWFAIFGRAAGAEPTLIARTMEPVRTPTDWNGSNLDTPQAIDDGGGPPESWLRFDLAAYKLGDGHPAFGVRAGWSEGYAGGGASFEALYLFMQDGKTLHPVFAAPMSFMKMIAGDWNKDGTRNHDVTDGSNVLVVSDRATAGYRDLQLRERKGSWRKTYRWSEKDGLYVRQ
ncbi:hypothetical protein [Cupriavidus plantarum]|uniref:Uncharacterized protein n=1 Tax=Cupriavidus plantarum TaxID=942865 RepID=A0A316ENA9_9BURK|nr:hypothetical protein [Cupriavidus plantarum]PWK33971.1 hypothetical protein C7419_103290 [Cupriavidus plantarum]